MESELAESADNAGQADATNSDINKIFAKSNGHKDKIWVKIWVEAKFFFKFLSLSFSFSLVILIWLGKLKSDPDDDDDLLDLGEPTQVCVFLVCVFDANTTRNGLVRGDIVPDSCWNQS